MEGGQAPRQPLLEPRRPLPPQPVAQPARRRAGRGGDDRPAGRRARPARPDGPRRARPRIVRDRRRAGAKRGGSSTWQSLARGRGAEGDYLYGEIALLARLHGLRAPLNEAVQTRIATVARQGVRPRSLPMSDIAELLGYSGMAAPLAML
ncbi:ketopantoate reductase C-terminal domain-containing protein [Pseudonocardia benzenivorans]